MIVLHISIPTAHALMYYVHYAYFRWRFQSFPSRWRNSFSVVYRQRAFMVCIVEVKYISTHQFANMIGDITQAVLLGFVDRRKLRLSTKQTNTAWVMSPIILNMWMSSYGVVGVRRKDYWVILCYDLPGELKFFSLLLDDFCETKNANNTEEGHVCDIKLQEDKGINTRNELRG